jgi:cysteine synthase
MTVIYLSVLINSISFKPTLLKRHRLFQTRLRYFEQIRYLSVHGTTARCAPATFSITRRLDHERLGKMEPIKRGHKGAVGDRGDSVRTQGKQITGCTSYDHIFDMVGHTPSMRLRLPNVKLPPLFLKLEGYNPTGSIKDRACVFMMSSALKDGSLGPGKAVLDASSGNFACALAFYARILGHSSVVAVSSKLTSAKREFLKYLGTKIYEIGDFTIEGNEFCRKLAQDNPSDYYFLDQLHNWQNPRAHFEGTGPEILSEFPDVAMVIGSLGSGGTMTGVAQYLKQANPEIKIVTVECSSGSRIPGTGSFVDGDYITPFIRDARKNGLFDETIQVTEAEAAKSVRLLLEQGVFVGLQTGAVLHATLSNLTKFSVTGPVVALSGDIGWKSLDKLVALTFCRTED